MLGHIGRPVETKLTPTGKQMHKFSMYTADGPKDSKRFSWYEVIVWGDMPNFKLDALVKGATVFVTGRLEVREWEAKDGGKGKSVEITADAFNGVNVVAPPKDRSDGVVSRPRSARPAAQAPASVEIDDSDCPF